MSPQAAQQSKAAPWADGSDAEWARRSRRAADPFPGAKAAEAHMARVEARLREVAARSDQRLGKLALHLIEGGGKRLRPALVVSSAIAACGAEGVTSRVTDAAAAIELLHLASLFHDDVLDSASKRRERPSANSVWGNRVAVLAGDALLSHAFWLAADLRRDELRRFCSTVAELCSGEVAEAEMQFDRRRGLSDYEASIRDKTASLVATSCWLGASITGATESVTRALERFGGELGLAFQVIDDVMDLCADERLTGKTSGSDLRAGVFTLPVLLTVPHDPALTDLLVEGIEEQGVQEVQQRVRAVGGDRMALRVASERVESALACISSSEGLDPEGERLLVSIAESVLEPVDRLGLTTGRREGVDGSSAADGAVMSVRTAR
jgi:heptaprenyl diphosphate synthase